MSKSLRNSGGDQHSGGDPVHAGRGRRAEYRVLVADDDAGCRDSLVSLLIHDGFRASSVSRGQQAINEIRRGASPLGGLGLSGVQSPPGVHPERSADAAEDEDAGLSASYDFAVFDYNLPDLTGLEILRVVRRDLHLPLPAILVTGEFTRELERQVLEIGGFAVMKKPVKPEQFREIVWGLVERYLN